MRARPTPAAGLLAVLAVLAAAWVGCAGMMRAARIPQTAPASSLLAPWTPGMTLRQTFETFPETGGGRTRLRLLVDNTEAWVERWRLLAETERSLDVTYFILDEDLFGAAFLGHLIHKARHGVRIRILLDAIGTKMSWGLGGSDYIDELADTDGVTVRMFRPRVMRYLEALLALDPTVALASEHDKIIVSDGRRSLIGGRNIASEYFVDPETDPDAYHDTDLRLDGAPVAAALTRAFAAQFASRHARRKRGDLINLVSREEELLAAYHAMDAWLRADPAARADGSQRGASGGATTASDAAAGGERWQADLAKLPGLRSALHEPAPRAFAAESRVLDSRTRPGGASADDPITAGLVRLIDSARATVLIQSPYLVLSEKGVEVLARAGRRGVAITVLTNSPVSSDNALSQAFFLEQWPEILARVPGMRLFVGGSARTLHDKVAVFDHTLALVGTYNLDPTSMALNSEVVAAVWSRAFARTVAAEPERIIAAGPPGTYEYTIVRDAAGNPVRDAAGRPQVAFGPRDHCTPEQWTALGVYWTTLKAVKGFTGFSALL